MTQHTDSRHEPAESSRIADTSRYAAIGMEDGYVLYDTENAAAWIASDTTHDPAEAM